MSVECDSWAAKQIVEVSLGKPICEPFIGLILKDEEQVTGAIIFNGYDKTDVHFTCVLNRPIGVRDARYVARYVFGKLGCKRCTAVTSEYNMAARRALLQLGFKHEGILRDHFEDADGFIYGILRSEQKIARM
jgi:RimJ/RimL family protein N-acetyltransferase